MKSFITLQLLPLLAAASPLLNIASIHRQAAPLLSSVESEPISDSYIVVFKDHVTQNLASVHQDWVKNVHLTSEDSKNELRKRSLDPFSVNSFNGLKHTYNIAGGLLGYSGHFDEEVIEQIRSHPDVDYIEKDSLVHTMDNSVTEKNAPWGLARISHRDGLSFGNFNKYLYTEEGGEGVDVYIIDTGTNVAHVDFEGRASWGKTIPDGDEDADGNGHGTHCSGTAVGKKYGVAKKAHVKAVKVLRSNGSGSMSDVVKGVEFAVEAHLKSVEDAKKGKKKGFKGSTANMSLGGGKSVTLDKAVNAAVEFGLHFAVAAGNDNADSCKYSPAAAANAVTVGASSFADERAYFSNYGTCNDIFAPGLNILSTWIGSKYATNTISGTSMASPHIAGLLAYMLSLQPAIDSDYAVASISPKKLKANLIAIATEGALTNVPSNTANILAWNGGGSGNYTDIVHKGGYTVQRDSRVPSVLAKEFQTGAEAVESTLEEEIENVKGHAQALSQETMQLLDQLKERLEEFLAEY